MLNMLAFVVEFDKLLPAIVTTLIFVVIGIVFFVLAYVILGMLYPIHKEIEEDQNTALGIIIGSIMIGIAIIIAAAMVG
jgi:uncharacterized membrane protein YjfL (UPF0719 family)